MFQKAERKKVKLKIALCGVSGSGKTMSALRLAHGLSKKIALIDTENDSASLYSEKLPFDGVTLEPPFTTEKYIEAIQVAVKMGYEVLVIDSLSHAWIGDGGVLDQKQALDETGRGNSYTNWGKMTKKQDKLTSAILQAPIHVIATMRSKQEYSQVEEGGKKVIKKLGLAPQQRDGLEYEFTTVFEVYQNHEAQATKDRTGLFGDRFFQVTEKTGESFLTWLLGGAQESPQPPKPQPGPAAEFLKDLEKKEKPYVIPFGEFKGKTFDEVGKEALSSYYESKIPLKNQFSQAQDQLMMRIANYLLG